MRAILRSFLDGPLADYSPEREAHWYRCVRHCPGGMQLAGALVDPERDHRIRVLVAHQHQPARWVNIEAPRNRSLRRGPANQTQLARRLIDPETDDAVVASIRAIYE